MKLEDVLGVEQVVFQSEEGEQKVYVLPDEEAVEQLLAKLREDGVSDTIQLALSRKGAGQENKQQDIMLDEMASRLRGITETPIAMALPPAMGEIEELLGDEYLAMDGEQKVYVLPEGMAAEELLSNVKGLRTGEIKQSQLWRKTDIQMGSREDKEIIAAMDQRIQRLESLLKQMIAQDTQGKSKGIE